MTTYNDWKAQYRICAYCKNWDRPHQVRMALLPGFADFVAGCAAKAPAMTCASNGDGCMSYVPTDLAQMSLSHVSDKLGVSV
ncbi:MAG: hypothetical protein WC248_02775 [Candidatus Methanomethylophilaceae archaeon]|jgi:hypothetical protein